MREGEQKDLKREMKTEKSEARDKKYNIAKRIVSHKGSDEKYQKQEGAWGDKSRSGSLQKKEKDESRKGRDEGALTH